MTQLLKELELQQGSATNMITMYIAAGKDIWLSVAKLEQEYSDAANIRDKANNKAVKSALKSALHLLREIRQTPMNGLAMFVGGDYCL